MSDQPLKTKKLSIDTLDAALSEQLTGSKNTLAQDQTIINVAGLAPGISTAENSLDWALQQLADFKPKDSIESMLVQQMIAVNTMAMSCSKNALLDDQSVHMYDLNMRHAAKLMNTFSNLAEALNKHRGKNQSTTIKNQQVNVGEGGQRRENSNDG